MTFDPREFRKSFFKFGRHENPETQEAYLSEPHGYDLRAVQGTVQRPQKPRGL
jgi:hypothetical protein